MILAKLGGERQTAADIERKLNGTYILVKLPEIGETTALVSGVRKETISLKTAAGVVDAWSWEDVDVLKMMPESGIYSTPSKILVARRIPNRQNQDGACPATLEVKVEGEELISDKINLALATVLYQKQKDQSPKEAIQAAQDTKRSQRVSDRFWIKHKQGKFSVCWNVSRIGSWEMGSFFWSAGARIFEEELKDVGFQL